MKRIEILIVCLFAFILVQGQGYDDNGKDNRVSGIPPQFTNSTLDIATYINEHFNSENEKVAAIYAWVTANIRYSTDSANSINLCGNEEAKITIALKRRRGVCENYAAIFNDITRKCGITCFVVSGFTKQNGNIDKIGHSWCAAFVEKQWQLFDPTWDEGSGMNTRFFKMPPSEFILTHMPYDPVWQLLNYPLTNGQFYSGMYKKKDRAFFNYNDSLHTYVTMDSLLKFQSSLRRMQQDDMRNDLVKNYHKILQMNIEMIHQHKDAELYNSSVTDLLDAAATLNHFLEYRNHKFSPEKPDSTLQAFFDATEQKLHMCINKLDEVDRSVAILTIDTYQLREKIKALRNLIHEQKDFVNTYTSTSIQIRRSLFSK